MANGNDFDPILMRASVNALTQSVDALGTNINDMTNRLIESMDKFQQSVRGVGDEMEDAARRGEAAFAGMTSNAERSINTLRKQWEKFTTSPVGQVGARAVGGIRKGIKAALGPMGAAGIMSWMIKGMSRPQYYAAEQQKVIQQLQQAGGLGGGKFQTGLGMWGMHARFGREMTGDLAAGLGAFAGGGYGVGDIFRKKGQGQLTGLKGGFGKDALRAGLALDSLFEAGAGTSSKNAAQFATDMNTSLAEGVNTTRELGLATRAWGMSYSSVMSSVTQTTAALRIQGTSLAGITDLMGGLFSAFQAGTGTGPGGKQRAGALAAEAMGGMGAQLMAMPMGWQARIGQKTWENLMPGGTAGISGQEAVYKMRMGFGKRIGEQPTGMKEGTSVSKAMLQAIIEDLRNMPAGLGRMMFAESMGFSGGTLRGVLALADQDPNAAPTKLEGKQRRDAEKELRKALGMEAAKTPDYQRKMLKLNELMAKLGGSLLATVTTGLAALLSSLDYGWAEIKASVSGIWGGEDPELRAEADRKLAVAAKWSGLAEKSSGALVGAMTTAMKEAPDLLGSMFSNALKQGLVEFKRQAAGEAADPHGKRRRKNISILRFWGRKMVGGMEGGKGTSDYEMGKKAVGTMLGMMGLSRVVGQETGDANLAEKVGKNFRRWRYSNMQQNRVSGKWSGSSYGEYVRTLKASTGSGGITAEEVAKVKAAWTGKEAALEKRVLKEVENIIKKQGISRGLKITVAPLGPSDKATPPITK